MTDDKTKQTQVLDTTTEPNLDFRKDQYILLEIYGFNMGKRYDIDGENIMIGRSPACNIVLEDEGVSRQHLKIMNKNKQFFIVDLQSTNGTFVNNKRVLKSEKLENGDKIRLGRTIFKFICSDDIEAEYYDQLYQFSIKDGLTGLLNKKTLMENLEKEVKRAIRYDRQLSLLMIDIDHFKNVNDTYGHIVGDKVIVAISETLKKYFRKADTVGRFGGEEFTVILPETTLQSAILSAERLRLAVSQIKFNTKEKITISIGIAELDSTMKNEMDLLKKADQLLYKAKQNGRNRAEHQ